MFPDIARIGGIAIHTYGLMIAFGIIAGVYVVRRECLRLGLDEQRIIDALFWAIWAGIIGSRIFYVAYFPAEFIVNPLEFFKLWKGGLVFHGGFIFGLGTVIVLFRKQHIPVIRSFDALVAGVPLAHFFGRLGCFAAGCCFGDVCELPWAVRFTHPDSIAPLNVPLHPTQLYEATANLGLFITLFTIRKKSIYEGAMLGFYLAGYGVIRFVVEFFRGDPRSFHAGLSSAQWISVLFFAAGIFFIFRAYGKHSNIAKIN